MDLAYLTSHRHHNACPLCGAKGRLPSMVGKHTADPCFTCRHYYTFSEPAGTLERVLAESRGGHDA